MGKAKILRKHTALPISRRRPDAIVHGTRDMNFCDLAIPRPFRFISGAAR
jgi:hypothetical protein